VSRDTIVRLQKTEYTLVSSLQRDPLLAERIKWLRTVPGVGPITALTWALEMGEVSRFPSIREAISYCGLCGDEKSSADKVTRTPLSKQRNKHIHVCWWKPRRWRPDRIMFWPWSMKEKNRREC
jgi:transposase